MKVMLASRGRYPRYVAWDTCLGYVETNMYIWIAEGDRRACLRVLFPRVRSPTPVVRLPSAKPETGKAMRNGWRFYFVRTRPSCQQQAVEFVSCWFPLCKCSVLPTTAEMSFPVA